jgi:uncharacterized protein
LECGDLSPLWSAAAWRGIIDQLEEGSTVAATKALRGQRTPKRAAFHPDSCGKLWPSQCLVSCFLESLEITNVRVQLMAISQDLLEILACPACKAKVELKPDGSALKCVECRRVYPIRDDIPVMLVDEATIEDEPGKQSSTP